MLRRFLAAILVAAGLGLATAEAAIDRGRVEADFKAWLNSTLWPAAQLRGVSRRTFDRAVAHLQIQWKLPDLVVPGAGKLAPKVQRQSEFRSPARYFSERNLQTLVAIGRRHLSEHSVALEAIERRYGVPRQVLLAIWGRESAYGRASLPHDALSVLSTLAFMGRRKAIFFDEAVAALVILEEDHVSGETLKSSWAGALGGPQFLPTKFLSHAVDFDGDGRRDIWNSTPDILASIANYLNAHGWRSGRDWGFEVQVPAQVSCALEGPEQGRLISEWAGMGIARVSGRPFPRHEWNDTGYLLMPAGRFGPAFVATPNFYVLKTYNESDAYALFIGHLADRIAYTNAPFKAGWRELGELGRRDVQQMQNRLEKRGFDVGGADGLVGFKTRTAIGRWQEQHGLPATCYPDAGQVERIR